MKAQISERFASQMDAFTCSGRMLDDGVIDPRDTRRVLSFAFDIACTGDARAVRPVQFGVARP
jgi:geranyl-CoA carboxylase beta subunit